MAIRKRSGLFFLILLALFTLGASPFLGMEWISPTALLIPDNVAHVIFWQMRLPRVLAAFLAGAGLAMSGMTFQAMFRNALADPFTLGISSGAALGAAFWVRFGITGGLFGAGGITLLAFGGALGTIGLVYGITRLRPDFSNLTLLLAGVAVNYFFSSLVLFLHYTSDFTQSYQILRWIMGGLEVIGYEPVLGMLFLIVIGGTIILWHARDLDLLLLGEDLAISRGMDTMRTQTILFIVTSLIVGGVVAVCGPIGFVGLMVPHINRLLFGMNHHLLFFANILLGGTFLIICDTIARILVAPQELPVGIITSILGGPFFLWLLLRKDRCVSP